MSIQLSEGYKPAALGIAALMAPRIAASLLGLRSKVDGLFNLAFFASATALSMGLQVKDVDRRLTKLIPVKVKEITNRELNYIRYLEEDSWLKTVRDVAADRIDFVKQQDSSRVAYATLAFASLVVLGTSAILWRGLGYSARSSSMVGGLIAGLETAIVLKLLQNYCLAPKAEPQEVESTGGAAMMTPAEGPDDKQ